MGSVPGQMTRQFVGQTFGLCDLSTVTFQVAPQLGGLVADAVDSEDEVEHRPDEGHEPDETDPRDGGARITFFENRVRGRQHGEKQSKKNDSDVPDLLHKTAQRHDHCGPPLISPAQCLSEPV